MKPSCQRSLLLLFLLLTSFAYAQEPAYKSLQWQENPAIHVLKEDLKTYPAVIVFHSKLSELRVEDGGASTFYTEQKIVHVNSDAGIEKFNKVAIPMHNGRELISLQVRSIDSEGKVTNLRKENLKELKNVDGYNNYKIFAVEGLGTGGEVEYMYTVKSNPQSFGREIFQHDIPVLESEFLLVYPLRFNYTAKSYNGLPEHSIESFDAKRRSLVLNVRNIPALEEEEYSAHKASLMRLDFKLKANNIGEDRMAWSNIAEQLLKSAHDPKGPAKVTKFLKALNLEGLSELEMVRAVERHIKKNFTIKEGGNDAYEELKEVISKRVGNERGLLKLYVACFQELGIAAQLVFTCDRFDGLLDPQFSSPMNISEVLIYFRQFDKYLVPGTPYYRLGGAPENVAGGNGLFVTYYTDQGAIEYKMNDILPIKPLDYTHNNLGVKATFRLNNETPEVQQEFFWQGYRAALYRGVYFYQDENGREEFLKGVTMSGIENYTVIKRELEGQDIDLSEDSDSYFRVKTHYQAPALVEKAGDDYLVAVGKIIGKQSELYQEKQRQTDVAFRSVSNYIHEIEVEIPQGYTCSGLESAKINHQVVVGTEAVMQFSSDYKLEGNRLILKVNEFYKQLSLPRSKYEDFRSVVNGAADFNKLVLVLHPVKN